MTETGICDCCYNVAKQLVKKTEFLWYADRHMVDAQKEKHPKCKATWDTIITDEKKHVEMLKRLIEGGLC